MRYVRYGIVGALALGLIGSTASRVLAVAYASNVTKTGTTVSFVLNSPADVLSYSINGGAPIMLDGSTKGTKTFSLTSINDKFSIVAERNDAVGYAIPIEGTIGNPGTGTDQGFPGGLSQQSNLAGYNLLSDDASPLVRFHSPRGVAISNDPNAPNFGTAYITNVAAQAINVNLAFPGATGRTMVGRGVYALKPDQSDAYDYGDVGQNPLAEDGYPAFSDASTFSPYRLQVAKNGDLYVADYSAVNGGVFWLNPDLTASKIILAGLGGQGWNNADADPDTPGVQWTTQPVNLAQETSIPLTQYHGGISSVHIEGSLATNDLVVYGVDEDLNSAHLGGAEKNDRNSVWRWQVGGDPGPLGSAVVPTKIGGGLIGDYPAGGILIDMERGADGKFYLSQYRINGEVAGIQVIDADGTERFNSLAATRDLLGNQSAADIFRHVQGIAVSPDQKWLAASLTIGDLVVMPLEDGIPDVTARRVIDTPYDLNQGRDIAFDAAGNIHYVSSGQQIYRVLAPGGHSVATTSWDGAKYVFGVESVSAGLLGDFNDDGVVNGNDFLKWQRDGGSAADLQVWKDHFGQTADSQVASVPEPATLTAGLVAAILGLSATRRRKT